ncbi:MAG: hypothetical protein KC492_01845 [Myxococcales bacterium]|nr:hypothetical protein [Myxococcales bacterium]
MGWLEPEHEYTRGAVDPSDLRRLCELAVDPWMPAVAGGFHVCRFCGFTGGLECQGIKLTGLGWSNLYIPDGNRIYEAPSMIVHYIDAHGYAPPEEFLKAVRKCPEMNSPEYDELILSSGGKSLMEPPSQ